MNGREQKSCGNGKGFTRATRPKESQQPACPCGTPAAALPPLGLRQFVHAMAITAPQHREEDIRYLVEKDAVVAHARVAQQDAQFGPDLVVPPLVFGRMPRQQLHREGDLLHGRHRLAGAPRRRSRTGTVIVTSSSAPITIVMMIPGTFASPSP